MAKKSAARTALGNDPFARTASTPSMRLLSLDPTIQGADAARKAATERKTSSGRTDKTARARTAPKPEPAAAPAPKKTTRAARKAVKPGKPGKPAIRKPAAKAVRAATGAVRPEAPVSPPPAVPLFVTGVEDDAPRAQTATSRRAAAKPRAAEAPFARMQRDLENRLRQAAPATVPDFSPDHLRRIDDLLQQLEKADLPEPSAGLIKRLTQAWRYFQLFGRSMNVDDFGLDPKFEELVQPLFEFMYNTWWRVDASGLENVPAAGRALLVANHSGMLPWDGGMIKHAIRAHHTAHREVRPLVEDFVYHLPFLGALMARIGGVRACQENAQRLLEKDELVVVFPEGVKGIAKLYRYRYQLQRFGRGGFVKLCLRTGAPIIPVSVVGAEEIHPIIARADFLARPLKTPVVPITPTLPLLGPLGLIPLPTKWFIHFGKPIDLSHYGPAALQDELLINRITSEVRATIQEQIYEQLKKRRSVFLG